MNNELIRMIEAMARDRNIDPSVLFDDLEMSVASGIRKAHPESEDVVARFDRETGEITAFVDGEPMNISALGRIAAQTVKQVMIQRFRESERDSIYEEFIGRRGEVVSGKAVRFEGGSLIVEIERAEAMLPKSEQIPGESFVPEDRIRAMVLDVREDPGQVRIVLSRSHPDFIRSLFEIEVPEVAEGLIEVKGLAREAGYRTKVAVESIDPKVDPVGACVGIRGSRIRNIVDELGGEKIDIVRWNESSKVLIANSLKPAEVAEIALCFELNRGTVVVTEDQLSLAIGKRGQNVRLAARLTGWDIDILTPTEFNVGLDTLEQALKSVDGVESTVVNQIIAMGMVNVLDVEEVGPDALVEALKMNRDLAQRIVVRCAEEAKLVAERKAQAEADAKAAAEAPQAPPVEEPAAPVVDAEPEVPTADEPAGETASE
jgi:transcription termination/antitermination protein NusA